MQKTVKGFVISDKEGEVASQLRCLFQKDAMGSFQYLCCKVAEIDNGLFLVEMLKLYQKSLGMYWGVNSKY